jgi:ATP synthase protein I
MTRPDDPDRIRLDRLAHELEQLRRQQRGDDQPQRQHPHAAASHLVLRLLTDLIAGLIAGLLLGWGLDTWLQTTPWGIVAGSLLGLAAGVRNVLRTADAVSRKPPDDPQKTA